MSAELRFLGHAGFQLAGGGADVVIDPFLTGNPKGAASADALSPDVILLTHGHADHLGDTVIPIHYDTFPPIETDAQAFKADIEAGGFGNVVILSPGETHAAV